MKRGRPPANFPLHIRRMLYCARQRAVKHGVPITITEADIVVPELCPALGIPLEFGRGAPSRNSPSLDRFYPERGYVRGNVFVISHLANLIKKKFTARDLMHNSWSWDTQTRLDREAVARWMRNCEAIL